MGSIFNHLGANKTPGVSQNKYGDPQLGWKVCFHGFLCFFPLSAVAILFALYKKPQFQGWIHSLDPKIPIDKALVLLLLQASPMRGHN